MEIKRGAIFIGSNTNIFNRFTDFKRCGVVIDSTPFTTYILSSRLGKIDIISLEYYKNLKNYEFEIFNINIPSEKIDTILHNVFNIYYGKKYYLKMILNSLVLIFKKLINSSSKSNNMISSELTAVFLKNLMIDVTAEIQNWNENLITPKQIRDYIIRNSNYFNPV